MPTDTRPLIALVAYEVQLIATVLETATAGCSAAPPADSDATPSAATLGRVTARWTQIAESSGHGSVVNLLGESLFGVRLTHEEWDLVRAQLAFASSQLVLNADEDTLEGQNDMLQADDAMWLVKKISEAIDGG